MSSEPQTEERRRYERPERRSYLAKVARLYYLEEMNQRDIAEKLNISIASVSRALSRAKELDIVRISISENLDRLGELEIAMERRWKLDECLLVPRFGSRANTYQEMANRVTELLSRILERGDTLGVSWGETLKTVSENLGRIGLNEVDVVPVVGAMGTVETGIYPNSIAREFADRIGGRAFLMNTPAVVDSREIRDSLTQDSNFQMVRQIWDRLKAVLMSVSALDEETSAYKGGIFTSRELEMLRERGGSCATNFSILDAQGRQLDNPISERITNLPFDELTRIPHVVVIAAGEHKIEPLRSALRGGVANVLITDMECAEALLH
ncbi:MAG: sugar-binding transcriptional regulator [Alkalispirochaetaceae bacterium]